MSHIWRYSLSKELKVRFFKGTVESILLCGCEAWALTEAMEHSLDGTYTRMLRKALNIHWSSHTPNEVIWRPPSCQQHNCRQKTTVPACRPLHPLPRTQRTTSSAMGAQPRSQRTGKTQGNIRGHHEEGHGCAVELATLMRDRGIWHGHVVGRR